MCWLGPVILYAKLERKTNHHIRYCRSINTYDIVGVRHHRSTYDIACWYSMLAYYAVGQTCHVLCYHHDTTSYVDIRVMILHCMLTSRYNVVCLTNNIICSIYAFNILAYDIACIQYVTHGIAWSGGPLSFQEESEDFSWRNVSGEWFCLICCNISTKQPIFLVSRFESSDSS